MKTLAKIVACTLAYLIVVDIVGAVLSLFFEIVPLLGVSAALFYAIWFVAGVFCGLLSYNSAGELAYPKQEGSGADDAHAIEEWTSRADAGRTGLLVISATATILVALSFLFRRLWWQYGNGSSNYVPDSEPLTLMFFATILASVIFAHTSLRPKPKKVAYANIGPDLLGEGNGGEGGIRTPDTR